MLRIIYGWGIYKGVVIYVLKYVSLYCYLFISLYLCVLFYLKYRFMKESVGGLFRTTKSLLSLRKGGLL